MPYHLLRHPVGRLSTAARWYLASLALLALLMVTAHFAIQVEVQKYLNQQAQQWTKSSGVKVGHMRYRMLRGALSISRISIQQDGITFEAPSLMLYGNATSLLQVTPKISHITLFRPHIHISRLPKQDWLQKHPFVRILLSAQTLAIQQGTLQLEEDTLRNINLHWQHKNNMLETSAQGTLDDGRWQARAQIEPATWHITTINSSWQDIHSDTAFKYLSLSPVGDKTSGNFNWRHHAGDTPDFDGDLRLQGQHNAHVTWRGEQTTDGWMATLVSADWPLQSLTPWLPVISGYRLDQGSLSSKLQLSRQQQNFQLQTTELTLKGLQLQASSSPQTPLKIAHLQAKQLQLDTGSREISATHVLVQSGQFTLNPPATGSQTAWKLNVADIELADLQPLIPYHQQPDTIPALQGHMSWIEGQPGKIQLHSLASSEEQWQLDGSNTQAGLGWRVQAAHIPLNKLRPWLPEPLQHAEGLQGSSTLDIFLQPASDAWVGKGQADIAQLQWQGAGESWRTDSLHCEFSFDAKAGFVADNILASHWHYQTALKTIPLPMANNQQTGQSYFPMPGWKIGKVQLSNGDISIGKGSSIWMQDTNITLTSHADAPTEIIWQASLGEGPFFLRGTLNEQGQWLSLKASLRDALPFFLHDWLRLSGAPRMLRGRIYANLNLQRKNDALSGKWLLRLQHGLLESGVYPQDPLLLRTGHSTLNLFQELNQNHRIRLSIPLHISGAEATPLLDAMGQALVNEVALQQSNSISSKSPPGSRALLYHIRLHKNRALSLNERSRLTRVLRKMAADKAMVIELEAQTGLPNLDQETIERVRKTQGLIEHYLRAYGAQAGRIFPVWPNEQGDNSTTRGIRIMAVQP